tara:strand:+ start:2356 stop:3339 length:984 start_codon:yes stop_codon:yes gene_type:complete
MKILYPISLIYQLIVELRNLLYDFKILKTYIFPIPIISIGNIVMGGTGKTPMSLWLFNQLILKNKKPCIISRGYNRQSKDLVIIDGYDEKWTIRDIGDEPLMMLNKNKNIKMVICRNKIKGIQSAINSLDIDIIILDDGFQSRYIHKNLDIIMMKQQKNYLFPAGYLRESMSNLKRADIIIENNIISNEAIKKLCINNNIQTIHAKPTFQLIDEKYQVIKQYDDLNTIAVCGIGDPNSFLQAIYNYNINIQEKYIVADHYNYQSKDMNDIYAKMKNKNCNAIITTWKDYYKINALNLKNKKIIILDMNLKIEDVSLFDAINKVTNDT